MSKYTVELRWLVEQYANDAGHQETDPFDEHSWPDTYGKLGLANYPIFNESYRETLNNKIIRHFFVREIGFETAGLFRFYMNMKMQEIMPYYNQLYLSEQLEFDPLSTRNMSYHEEWNRDNTDDWNVANTGTQDNTWNSKNQTDSNSENSDREVFQDTPMSMLDNPSPNGVENLKYATTVTYQDGTTESHDTTVANGDNLRTDNLKELGDREKNEKGLRDRTEKGYDMSGSELLKKYRDTFLNIDMMIINELETLFMGIG